ncbi:MAG: Rne/Rng family ribonuclease [Bacteroidota bacterium]
MASELVIGTTQGSFRIALLKDRELVEYHTEEKDSQFTVGDICLGIVKKIMPNLNAVFVDLGYKKDAFLHYSDLGAQFRSLNQLTQLALNGRTPNYNLSDQPLQAPIDKLGKVAEVLYRSQPILVQVIKEPISSKGPRLSTELAIAGSYMILVPFSEEVSVSKKITKSEEKQRLLRLVNSIKPPNFGLIVRTAAEGKEVAQLIQDLKELLAKWEAGVKKLHGATVRDKIIGEIDRASSILRDMLNEPFDSIIIDDKNAYNEIKQYLKTTAPEKEKIFKYYQGRTKLFEHFGIERQLKMLFGQTVSLDGGGYLIIEHTEAMHVIDVNSGSNTTEQEHEVMALSVNLAAAKEIARQLKLRDMGGIIVIDFIGVKDAENKRKLYQQMKEYMKEDRSKSTILPISKFGIMQLTRQRVRPVTSLSTQEECPSCGGTGKIAASILISEQIEKSLQILLDNQNEKNIMLLLHPYLYAYFTRGFFSKRVQWFFRYKRWVSLVEDSSLGIAEFKFINKQGEEIELT